MYVMNSLGIEYVLIVENVKKNKKSALQISKFPLVLHQIPLDRTVGRVKSVCSALYLNQLRTFK